MTVLKDPGFNKLAKFLGKNPLTEATILHWTGSMWGIGCRLSSATAIDRINKLKQRPEKQGFIALIPDLSVLDKSLVPAPLLPLLDQYSPGNLSVVFAYPDKQFEHIAVEGKVAFRVPSDPMLRAFISLLGEPLISTSVNVSGLLPEEEIKKIQANYTGWFDFALLPRTKVSAVAKEHSTVVEYVKAGEAKSSSHQDELKCLREGSVPFYEVKQSFRLPSVMFVCTANTCRSPIAEKLFRTMLAKEGLAVAADSCGLIEGGHMISLNSLQLLLEKGITEAQNHVSKQVTPQMVNSSWLILTMEERQRDWLRNTNPNAINKIWTLNEIVGEEGDIKDPFGSDLDSYRNTMELIEDRLNKLLIKVKNGMREEKEA